VAPVILTIIGPDRPGLVRSLSEALAAHGGNWLEGRMARLAGHFAGIVAVDAPDAFLAGLSAFEAQGLRITVTPAGTAAEAESGPRLILDVVGHDRPGIVHEVTQAVAACGGNIEEMTTSVGSAAFSGEKLFRATITLRVGSEAAADALRPGLEELGGDMMVDVRRVETPDVVC
jgi:glycine cleavage system regulatory protein